MSTYFCKILGGRLGRGQLLVLVLEQQNRSYGFSKAYLNAKNHI